MEGGEPARPAFCNSYDGYGDLCDCQAPADIDGGEITFPYNIIEDVPVLIIAGNRPTELYRCLRTLLSQPGGSRSMIVVSLDSPEEEVLLLLKLLRIKHVTHDQTHHYRATARAVLAARITRHYQYSIDMIFNLFPEAPAAIIVEEDLLTSPNFFSYFNQTAWLLHADPSLFCISAWNDHGALHGSRDASRIMRIESFPGNGWMLSRNVYEDIMQDWRRVDNVFDWDVWLRQDNVAAQRECVVPEVSRVFHLGLTGAHVKGVMTQAHFAGHLVVTHHDTALSDVYKIIQPEYEKDIYSVLNDRETVYLNTSMFPCEKNFMPKDSASPVVVFFLMMLTRDNSAWVNIASCLGLWQMDMRGHHRGLFRFKFYNTSVWAIGYPFSDYSFFKPPFVTVIEGFNSQDLMLHLNNAVLENRIRHRVPDLEPFVPSLMIQKPTPSPTWI